MRSPLAAAALLACALLGAWLALALRRLRETAGARARQRQGARGERAAERMLEAAGYRIHARQHRTSYRIEVDRQAQEVELVLDFVVERDGEHLVAEVKTGRRAPRLERAETRRQLLEYQLATGCRRVLLVDADAGAITEVAFPLPAQAARSGTRWRALLAVALLAAALAWWRAAR